MSIWSLKKWGPFLGGVLFGTAGIKLLSSKDAKKAYAQCTAATLRMKDTVVKTATTIQENAEDILAEAKQINEDRTAKDEADIIDDITQECSDTEENAAEAAQTGEDAVCGA